MDDLTYRKFLTTVSEPAREAGLKTLAWYSINYAKQDLLVWQYQTGQRRVRLAPEFKYDGITGTPNLPNDFVASQSVNTRQVEPIQKLTVNAPLDFLQVACTTARLT